MTDTLPTKPSALIRTALADLAKCEADPRYSIDMGKWHVPNGSHCAVCLAGAVMAQSLGAKWAASLAPYNFGREQPALRSLDMFITGWVREALDELDIELPAGIREDRLIAPYDREQPAAFHADMNTLANDLEGAGL